MDYYWVNSQVHVFRADVKIRLAVYYILLINIKYEKNEKHFYCFVFHNVINNYDIIIIIHYFGHITFFTRIIRLLINWKTY